MLLHLILVLQLMDAVVRVEMGVVVVETVTGKWEEVSPLIRRLIVPGEGGIGREGME